MKNSRQLWGRQWREGGRKLHLHLNLRYKELLISTDTLIFLLSPQSFRTWLFFPQFLFISIFSSTTVNSCFFIFLSCLLFLCPVFCEIYARMVIIIKPWRLLLLRYWVKSREKYISPDSLGMREATQPWSFDNLVIRIFVFAPDLWLLQIYDCALGRLAAFSAEGSRSDLRLVMWPWKCESWLGGLKRWGGG